MPPVDDDFTILTCACGKRLKAPGAHPGRVGQCPACGGILRAPGKESEPAVAAPARVREIQSPGEPAPPRKKKKVEAPIPYGSMAPREEAPAEEILPERIGLLSSRKDELSDANRQVGRGGILPLPRRTKFGMRDALLYPIWDMPGLSWLIFLPAILGFSSLVVFGLIPIVMQGGRMLIFGPFAFPMIIVLTLAVGYLLQILTEVVIASSAGDIHHPKWPDIEFGALAVSLFQWTCGLAIGLSLAAMPAIAYWRLNEEHGLRDHLVVAGLLACGLSYALMSIASLVLHGDLMAANPVTVLHAIFQGGAVYLTTFLLSVVAVLSATLAVEGLYRIENFFVLLLATYFAWVFLLYAALAVARSLGMCLHVRCDQIGWFPDRPRWGVGRET